MTRTRAATQRRHNAARIVRLRLTEHRAFNVAFYTVFSWTHSSVCNVTRCVCVCEHPATLRKETKDAARQTYVHCTLRRNQWHGAGAFPEYNFAQKQSRYKQQQNTCHTIQCAMQWECVFSVLWANAFVSCLFSHLILFGARACSAHNMYICMHHSNTQNTDVFAQDENCKLLSLGSFLHLFLCVFISIEFQNFNHCDVLKLQFILCNEIKCEKRCVGSLRLGTTNRTIFCMFNAVNARSRGGGTFSMHNKGQKEQILNS